MDYIVLAEMGLSYIFGWGIGFVTCSIVQGIKQQQQAQQAAKVTVRDLRPRD